MRAAPVASVRRAMSTAQRRHQIVESAAMLFDAQGYGNTSMEDVALAVSIAKPTLYHYFRSKEEILRSIHEEFIQLLTEKYLQRVSTGAEPEELALGAMKDILSLMVTHRGYVRVFFEHHRELPPDAKRYVTAQRDAYESLVQSAIGAGQARGHFTRNEDAKLVTFALFGMCNWAYQWFDVRGRYTADEIAETYWRLLLNGIQPAVDRLYPAGCDVRQPEQPERRPEPHAGQPVDLAIEQHVTCLIRIPNTRRRR